MRHTTTFELYWVRIERQFMCAQAEGKTLCN